MNPIGREDFHGSEPEHHDDQRAENQPGLPDAVLGQAEQRVRTRETSA